MIKQRFVARQNLRVLDDQSGLILVMVIMVFGVLSVIGLSILRSTTSQYVLTGHSAYSDNALLAAEAGVEQSLLQLNQSDSFAGYSVAQSFFNNVNQGKGSYTTTISNSATDPNAKVITSTGVVYRYRSPTKLVSKKIVRVTTVGTSSQGYSVQSGPGGLILGGSAAITNSDVYVGGTLTLTGATKIGTASLPLDVDVGNIACPTGATPGATYPKVCAGTQPIAMDYSTAIYGSVCATGQTSKGPNNNIQTGNGGTGLKTNCTAPAITQPTYDRAAQISRVSLVKAGTDNTYVCNSSPFNRTWPANFELTGNVSIASSCNLVIKGDTYITGNLDLGGAAKITIDNSVGATRPNIVVDGKITVGGSAQLIANNVGTGAVFYSFKSSASCAAACTTMSGNDLKTSSGVETVNIGGASNLSGMIFDAYWGKITLAGSGTLGSAVGQTIDMSGAGTLTFGTFLSSGSHTWTISSYQQRFPYQP